MKTSTNILCLFLAVLALAQHVKGSERLVGEYSQRFTDEALNQRLCVSSATSFKFLAHGLSNIQHRYLKFYNDPEKYTAIHDHTKDDKNERFREYSKGKDGLKTFDDIDIFFDVPQKAPLGRLEVVRENGVEQIVLRSPVRFHSVVDLRSEQPSSWEKTGAVPAIEGVIEFALHIAVENTELPEKNMWHLRLGRNKHAELKGFSCENYGKCEELKKFMIQELPKKVIYHASAEAGGVSDDPIADYRSPMAARQLMGLLKYADDFAARPMDTLHVMVSKEKELIYLFFNCHGGSIRDALEKPVPAGYTELSFYQNLLDNLGIPDEIEIDLQKLMRHPVLRPLQAMVYGDPDGPMHMLAELVDVMMQTIVARGLAQQTGLRPESQISFSKDPITLSQMDLQQVQAPMITNTTTPGKVMDDISIKQNVFLQLKDKAMGTDLTMIPLELNLNFEAAWRRGMMLKYGWTQEVKSSFKDFTIELKACQHVDNRFHMGNVGKLPKEKKELKDLRLSPLQQLVCQSIPELNQVLKERYLEELTDSLSFQDNQGVLGFLGQFNEWYPMPEQWMNEQAACSGMETREPLYWFDEKRMVWTFEINHKAVDMDDYCDSFFLRAEQDPRNLYLENDWERQRSVEARIAQYEDPLTLLNEQGYYYGARRVDNTRFFDHFWMGRVMPSTVVWYFTSYAYMKDWCIKHYPDRNSSYGGPLYYDNCALAHVNEKGNPVAMPGTVWRDFADLELSRTIRKYEWMIADGILAIGVIFNVCGVNLGRGTVLSMAFWVNLAMGSIYVFEHTGRYGIDYIAYLQQASAVYQGETDYTKLSSNLGPCFYPAGHLYHYLAAYWLHLQTEDAEYIIKFGHLVIHSLAILFMIKIAYIYFAEEKASSSDEQKKKQDEKKVERKQEKEWDETLSSRAQMIAFILVGNRGDRSYWSSMYNDEIMMLYMLIAIYYMLRNKPLIGSFWVTVALGVKAGVILLLPGLLGQIQYNHGTIKLLLSIAIIVGFQVIAALPFVLNDSTVADYIHRSKLTGAGRNGIARAALFWDYMAAHRGLSIFWTFIEEECYFDWPCLAMKLKIAMLLTNIYHFFGRKWCLPRCLTNLFETFDGTARAKLGIKTQAQIRLTLEVLILGYMGGIVTMPGANQQFQFWFTCLVPLVIEMIGLPSVTTFWISGYFYPIHGDPRYQHFFLLGLVAWLFIVGPRQSIVQDITGLFTTKTTAAKVKAE